MPPTKHIDVVKERPEPGVLGLVSVCSCARSSEVHQVRKISGKLGKFTDEPHHQTNGYTPRMASKLSARLGLGNCH